MFDVSVNNSKQDGMLTHRDHAFSCTSDMTENSTESTGLWREFVVTLRWPFVASLFLIALLELRVLP